MAIYIYNSKVRYSDVGEDNKLTLKALTNILQEAAISHSNMVGFGINNVESTHLAWLLLNWKIKMFTRPKCEDELIVKTWPKVFDKLYSYRDFEVYDTKNNLVAIASSKWFAVDNETKKVKKITPEISGPYGKPVEKSVFDDPFREKISAPENLKLSFNYTILRRDIDTNGHVNNLNYIDYAFETLDETVFNNISFNNLEIVYKKEIKLKESIKCYYSFIDNKHIITIKSADDTTIHSIIKLY